MELKRNGALFALGGAAYVGLELLWRRRSHSSMFFAGGTCFLVLGGLRKLPLSAPVQALMGAAAITAVELGTGLLVNRRYGVWDYREMPANFKGQICLPYSLLWVPVSIAAMELHSLLERKPAED